MKSDIYSSQENEKSKMQKREKKRKILFTMSASRCRLGIINTCTYALKASIDCYIMRTNLQGWIGGEASIGLASTVLTKTWIQTQCTRFNSKSNPMLRRMFARQGFNTSYNYPLCLSGNYSVIQWRDCVDCPSIWNNNAWICVFLFICVVLERFGTAFC